MAKLDSTVQAFEDSGTVYEANTTPRENEPVPFVEPSLSPANETQGVADSASNDMSIVSLVNANSRTTVSLADEKSAKVANEKQTSTMSLDNVITVDLAKAKSVIGNIDNQQKWDVPALIPNEKPEAILPDNDDSVTDLPTITGKPGNRVPVTTATAPAAYVQNIAPNDIVKANSIVSVAIEEADSTLPVENMCTAPTEHTLKTIATIGKPTNRDCLTAHQNNKGCPVTEILQAKFMPLDRILMIAWYILIIYIDILFKGGVHAVKLSQTECCAAKGGFIHIPWTGSFDDTIFINGIEIGNCNNISGCMFKNEKYDKTLKLKKLESGLYDMEINPVTCYYKNASVVPTGVEANKRTAYIHVSGCDEPVTNYDVPNVTCAFELSETKLLDTTGSSAIDCGGTVKNASGNISNSGQNQSMDCIWVIQVAAGTSDKPNIISASLSMTGNISTDNTLEVRDGASMCTSEYVPNVNKSILTRTNSLWVRYSYVAKDNTRPLNFTLAYSTYSCGMVCNNSLCMNPDWHCNGKNDCGDWSDEAHCTTPKPVTTIKPLPSTTHSDESNTSSSGYYILTVIGLMAGMVFVFTCIIYVKLERLEHIQSAQRISKNSETTELRI